MSCPLTESPLHELWVLKFRQTSILQTPLSHWAMLLRHGEYGTLFHLAASGGSTPWYATETCPAARWEQANSPPPSSSP